MIIRSPAWIVVGALALAQASGVIGNVATVISGIDNSINAVIDLRKFLPPPLVMKPIVVPSAKVKK